MNQLHSGSFVGGFYFYFICMFVFVVRVCVRQMVMFGEFHKNTKKVIGKVPIKINITPWPFFTTKFAFCILSVEIFVLLGILSFAENISISFQRAMRSIPFICIKTQKKESLFCLSVICLLHKLRQRV